MKYRCVCSSSSPPPYEKFHISRPAMVRILVEHIHDNLLGSEALKQNCHSGNTREGDGGRGGTSSEIEGRVDFGVEDELNGRCLEEIYKSCKAVFQGILPSSAWKMFLPILLAQVTTVSKSAEERAMIYGLVTNIQYVTGKSVLLDCSRTSWNWVLIFYILRGLWVSKWCNNFAKL